MDNETVSTEPIYEDHTIRYAGLEFVIASENDYEGSENAACEVAPGETPRRVMNGFVYGGRAWLAKGPRGLPSHQRQPQARLMLEADRARRLEAARTRSIPVDHHAEVYERSKTQSDRAIELWLTREKGCRTSYASVGRLIRQLKKKEACTRQRAQLEEEAGSLRIQLNATLDTLMDLQADFLQEHDELECQTKVRNAKPVRQQMPVVWRMHHQNASLIERRLRVVERDLAMLAREAERSPLPEPAPTPQPDASAPPVKPPETKPAEVTVEMAIDRPYGPERALFPWIKAHEWPKLELELAEARRRGSPYYSPFVGRNLIP